MLHSAETFTTCIAFHMHWTSARPDSGGLVPEEWFLLVLQLFLRPAQLPGWRVATLQHEASALSDSLRVKPHNMTAGLAAVSVASAAAGLGIFAEMVYDACPNGLAAALIADPGPYTVYCLFA